MKAKSPSAGKPAPAKTKAVTAAKRSPARPSAAAAAKSKTVKGKAAASAAAKKATPKAAGKPAAKAATKSAAKPAAKPAARPAVKPAPRPAVKPAAKPAAKAAQAKPAAKPTPTVKAKPAVKPVAAAKAVVKPAAKPAAPAKPPVKPAAKPAAPVAPKASAPVAPAALAAGSEVIVPSTNKKAVRLAMQAQTSEAVAPTHDPGAAKATFTPTVERAMPTAIQAPARKDPKLAGNWKKKPVEQLSDDEVLSMPDSEYMNEVQLAFFRRKLEQLKNEILASAGETTEHLREDTVVVPDPADRATIEEEHALELRTRDRERKLLKKIEQAIGRIDAGDYGYCDETGEPIGVGRLLARPTASLSIEAQQRRELKQKLFGD